MKLYGAAHIHRIQPCFCKDLAELSKNLGIMSRVTGIFAFADQLSESDLNEAFKMAATNSIPIQIGAATPGDNLPAPAIVFSKDANVDEAAQAVGQFLRGLVPKG